MNENLVVTTSEMRAIEADSVARGATWEGLMDRAGERIAAHILEWGQGRQGLRALTLSGPGNNGGDALVVARILADNGWEVRALVWNRDPEKDARLQAPLNIRGVPLVAMPPLMGPRLDSLLEWCTLVVDGLFGTGLQRNIEGDIAELIRRVSVSGKPTVGVDIPSGVDSDTGAVRGVAVPCDFTVTLGAYKYGLVQQPGARLAGKIYLGDIGLSDTKSAELASGELLTDKLVRGLLPARPDDANKGTFGKTMVVAGSINYVGAAALATEGALRSGAGLVTLGCAVDLLPILAVKITEATFLPLASDLGVVSERGIEKLRDNLEGYKSLLIGCGLTHEKETTAFLKGLLTFHTHAKPDERPIGFTPKRDESQRKPEEAAEGELPTLILDGDALNILSEWDEWTNVVPKGSVLTPHPGEMARLVKSTVEEVQADRVGTARKYAHEWNQVVVLKGAGTLIADPSGKIYVSPFSNPALAVGGSGDVLAGLIAGFVAQGLSALDAAVVGVYVHGLAGELLKQEYGVAGGLAGELPVLAAKAQAALRNDK